MKVISNDPCNTHTIDELCRSHLAPRHNQLIISYVVNLTPDLAGEFLAHNYEENRNVSRMAVMKLTKAINDGEYVFNAEPIIFDDQGRMIDGQQTCHAVIRAGTAIPKAVFVGVPDGVAAYATIDNGKNRTLHDIMPDALLPKVHAAVIRRLYTLAVYGYDWSGVKLGGGMSPTNNYLAHQFAPPYSASVDYAIAQTRDLRTICPHSIAAFCFYLCRTVDVDAAENYFDQLRTGELLARTDPAWWIRNKLIEMRAQMGGDGAPLRLPYLMRGFALALEGRPVKQLRLLGGGILQGVLPRGQISLDIAAFAS